MTTNQTVQVFDRMVVGNSFHSSITMASRQYQTTCHLIFSQTEVETDILTTNIYKICNRLHILFVLVLSIIKIINKTVFCLLYNFLTTYHFYRENDFLIQSYDLFYPPLNL